MPFVYGAADAVSQRQAAERAQKRGAAFAMRRTLNEHTTYAAMLLFAMRKRRWLCLSPLPEHVIAMMPARLPIVDMR